MGVYANLKSKNPIRKARRKRSYDRGEKRKDANVARSSNGKFQSVKALETHRKKVTKNASKA